MAPKSTAGTLYYDGSCPLCATEIRQLDRLAKDRLCLVDVHQLPSLSMSDKARLLTTLHLETHDGRSLTGLDATVFAWRQTSFGWLFAWLRWPMIKPLADRVYRYWADQRYRKRYL